MVVPERRMVNVVEIAYGDGELRNAQTSGAPAGRSTQD